MKTKTIIKGLAILIGLQVSMGCSTRTGKGAWIGAGTGGAIGGVIGKQSGNTAAGILLGAAIGGAAGASIGRYMDRQAAELQRDLNNARVDRVGEGIKITFNSGILFDTDSTLLRNDAKGNLNDLATTLNKYADTNVIVEGHTDSTGSTRYNQDLSEDRADAVATYLQTQGVQGQRISAVGKGEEVPIGDNDSTAGRQANRRVEVAIFANEKLKRAAEAGRV